MLRQLVVLFFVCAPNLVLCQDPASEEASSNTAAEEFKPLPMIQNNPALKPTLTAIKNAMVGAYPAMAEAITEQMKMLEELPAASEEKRHSIFRKFFDSQLKLFIGQLGLGDINIGDYRGLLTESDRELLGQFRNISTAETQVLIGCPPDFLPQYQKQEPTEHLPTWGEATCALRLMLQEMMKLKIISPSLALEVFKSMHVVYPEYATNVFTTNQVSGDILVLPLLLTQRVYEMIPRKKGATKALTLPGGITNSAVSDELAANGVTVEEVIDLIVKRIVKYYEKLEKDVFCKIRYRVSRLIGEQSPVGIALNFADAHACFGMREPEKKKTAAASKSTRQQ